MTTPPSTGSEPGVPDPTHYGLPDEATLNRLAGEFFAALPGSPASTVPAGVPGPLSPPPPVPTSAPSHPISPPPTSGPATYGDTAARNPLPLVPEVPILLAAAPATGAPVDPSSFYFLQPGAAPTPAAPASPSFGTFAVPTVPVAPPAEIGGFYFLDDSEIPALAGDPHPAFDVHAVRRDFPILSEQVNGRPLIWFDNAATTQKPQAVIDRLAHFYAHENSNIHRAAHELAARATDAYESARDTVARFIGADSPDEIVFVRGTTEAINLVAKAWGGQHIREGDEIVISHLEHHANIVPWQMLASDTGAVIKVIPVDDSGQILLDEYSKLLSDRTKIVAVTHVSNALGTVTPIARIAELAHRAGAVVLVDGAQSIPHTPIDVQALGADFFVFSGHKIFGPTGIGVLYGRSDILEDTPPWHGGGNMIIDVTLEHSTYQEPPGRFEAGTGNIADAAGLATALDYVERIGMPNISEYEHFLVEYATAAMREVPGLHIIGTADEKASVVSFVLDGYEPTEVGAALNEEGIAVRAGHHCAQPILRRYGLEATVRPSFAFYNTTGEIDTMVAVLHRLASRSAPPP